MKLRAKIAICSIGISLLASTALYAADKPMGEVQHSVRVTYADLNLNRAADVAKLYRRLSNAARNVCGPRNFAGRPTPGFDSCFADTIKQGVAAIDSAALTAYYEGGVNVAQSNGEISQAR
jgi:UrcA family protein